MLEITSLQHPLILRLVKLRQNARFRKSESSLLLEGKNCIVDLSDHLNFKRLIVSKKEIIFPSKKKCEIIFVTEAIMKKITGVEHPEGIVAEIAMPPQKTLENVKKIVVLDAISDPGNLGTILRTALALGWDAIFLLPGSCDPYNDKALRAAKGATFLIPLQIGSWSDLEEVISKNRLLPLIATMKADPPEKFQKEKKVALILGNEAKGVTYSSHLSYKTVSIPMNGAMESLNVAQAGAILMYQMRP